MGDGVGHAPTLGAGTFTLLLGDVGGLGQHPQANAMGTSVPRRLLDDLVTMAAGRFGGIRLSEHGGDDGFILGFSRAADAVGCALSLQSAIHAAQWPDEIDVRVRVALHTSDSDLAGAGNTMDRAIKRCARICALAHAGQILLSRATHDLVVDSLGEGVRLKDLGEHRLPDLARPERLYQLCHPDLTSAFPVLSRLGRVPNNLPVQLTTFIGRDTEMAEVGRMLMQSQLLTLTGAGGCGKTRLAIEVAADAAADFLDGVWWVDLAPIADPGLVSGAVAAVLAVREVPRRDFAEVIVESLRERRLLIVLDNCEHVLAGTQRLASAVVQTCPRVTILATSRALLAAEGEVAYRVPSLAFPDAPLADAAALAGYDAVRLFVERVTQVHPRFRFSNEKIAAITEICRRLDGIPLAIELAAARVRMLSPQQIAQRLSERFDVLTGDADAALPRQRTLEASIDWSYDLLTEQEQMLLARLSVFAGSFTLDAAEDVCSDAGIERASVLNLLSALVDKSLVHVEEAPDDARYRLLETLRAYASGKLADPTTAAAVRGRHLNHYIALAERAERELRGPALQAWLQRLDAELDNIRATLSWATERGATNEALRLVGAISAYWWVRGRSSEIEARLHAALAAPGGDPAPRVKALTAAEALAFYAGEFDAARLMGLEATALARGLGDLRAAARALAWGAWAQVWLDPGTAAPMLQEGLSLTREVGSRGLEAYFLSGLGFQKTLTGAPSDGLMRMEEAMRLSEQVNDVVGIETAWWFRALSLIETGRLAEAEATVQKLGSLSRAIEDAMFTSNTAVGLSIIGLLKGDYANAQKRTEELEEIARATGNEMTQAILSMLRAWLECVNGNWSDHRPFDVSLALLRGVGIKYFLLLGLWVAGSLSLSAGDTEAAREYFEDAKEIADAAGMPAAGGRAMLGLARVTRTEGDTVDAETLAHEALRALANAENRLGVIDALENVACLAAEQESFREAARLYSAACRLREETGYARFAIEQSSYDVDIATVRASLAEKDFAQAWEEGIALSFDDAIAYAERGRGERRRPSAGWNALTPVERQVAGLVTEGLTNPQIAERLFVARNTVKTHLQHVYGKLGVSTRAELAALVAKRSTIANM